MSMVTIKLYLWQMFHIPNYPPQIPRLSINRKSPLFLSYCSICWIYLFFFIFRNIPAQGQYEVYATTPGCVGSSNCFTRTQVEYQLQLSPDFPATTIISDQNVYNDDRFLLYSGIISPVSTNFRPSITLKPASNATRSSGGSDTVQIMAATIEFVRNMTGTPLVSVLEYRPADATNTSAISWKPLNRMYMNA